MAKRGRKKRNCPEDLVALLPELSVAEVCRRGGVCPQIARRWLKDAGVEVRTRGRPKMSKEVWMDSVEARHPGLLEHYTASVLTLEEIGEKYDLVRERVRQIGKRSGLPRTYVRKARTYPAHPAREEVMKKAGKDMDKSIAEEHGINVSTVARWRKEEGIKRFVPPSKRTVPSDTVRGTYVIRPDGDGTTVCRWPGCREAPKTRGLCPACRTAAYLCEKGERMAGVEIDPTLLLPSSRKGGRVVKGDVWTKNYWRSVKKESLPVTEVSILAVYWYGNTAITAEVQVIEGRWLDFDREDVTDKIEWWMPLPYPPRRRQEQTR